MPDRKKLITEDMEPDFLLLFDRLIPDVDMISLDPHEIFEGLASQQIKSWRGFIMMHKGIIQDMTKPHRHVPVSISSNSMCTLTNLKQWRSDQDDSQVYDINSYTSDDFFEYSFSAGFCQCS